MKRIERLTIGISGAALVFTSLQGKGASFKNLDFTEAVTNSVVNISTDGFAGLPTLSNEIYRGTTVDLFPDWQVTYRNAETGATNPISAYFSLVPIGGNWYGDYFGPSAVLMPAGGTLSGYVVGLFSNNLGQPGSTSISQVGQIPANADRLKFLGSQNQCEVRINNRVVELQYDVVMYSIASIGDFYADVSSFAGQTVEMRFTNTGFRFPGDQSGLYDHSVFGDVQFLPLPSVGISASPEGLLITFTGTLQAAESLVGPWADLAGTSPLTVKPSRTMSFYRATK